MVEHAEFWNSPVARRNERPRPLESARCSLCGIELPKGLMMPDGGGACADIRWYCRDTKSCTDRWTARPEGGSAQDAAHRQEGGPARGAARTGQEGGPARGAARNAQGTGQEGGPARGGARNAQGTGQEGGPARGGARNAQGTGQEGGPARGAQHKRAPAESVSVQGTEAENSQPAGGV